MATTGAVAYLAQVDVPVASWLRVVAIGVPGEGIVDIVPNSVPYAPPAWSPSGGRLALIRGRQTRHYLEVQLRQTRAGIRLGRGDAEAALEDAERGVEVGRSARDPQAALPSLAERARVLLMMGRPQEAVETIDELFERIDRGPAIDWSVWLFRAAIVLSEVGRADEFLALDIEHLPSLWMRAARHWAAGDLAGAGDTFEEIGAVPDEAYARMKEAERLLATGRRAAAEAPLSRALALSRSMGATAFIRDAERLLATPA